MVEFQGVCERKHSIVFANIGNRIKNDQNIMHNLEYKDGSTGTESD